jgi:hypothetical protein
MHDDEPDPYVDELLEASLKQYRGEEPRSGLEMRILAAVRTQERAARLRWLGWAVAVCAGILVAIALTLHFARAPHRQLTPSAELSPKESGARRAPLQAAKPPAPAMASQQRALSGPPRPVAGVRRVATRRSRPEQFPSPLPLTEQEKLLLAFLEKATEPDLVAGTNETDVAPVSDLEISRIKIAALEIKPLDDSQSEQEK